MLMEKKKINLFLLLFLLLTVALYDRMRANHFHGRRQNEKEECHLAFPPLLLTHLAFPL